MGLLNIRKSFNSLSGSSTHSRRSSGKSSDDGSSDFDLNGSSHSRKKTMPRLSFHKKKIKNKKGDAMSLPMPPPVNAMSGNNSLTPGRGDPKDSRWNMVHQAHNMSTFSLSSPSMKRGISQYLDNEYLEDSNVYYDFDDDNTYANYDINEEIKEETHEDLYESYESTIDFGADAADEDDDDEEEEEEDALVGLSDKKIRDKDQANPKQVFDVDYNGDDSETVKEDPFFAANPLPKSMTDRRRQHADHKKAAVASASPKKTTSSASISTTNRLSSSVSSVQEKKAKAVTSPSSAARGGISSRLGTTGHQHLLVTSKPSVFDPAKSTVTPTKNKLNNSLSSLVSPNTIDAECLARTGLTLDEEDIVLDMSVSSLTSVVPDTEHLARAGLTLEEAPKRQSVPASCRNTHSKSSSMDYYSSKTSQTMDSSTKSTSNKFYSSSNGEKNFHSNSSLQMEDLADLGEDSSSYNTPSKTEMTRSTIKRFITEVWNNQNMKVIQEVCHPHIRFHGSMENDISDTGRRTGISGFRQLIFFLSAMLESLKCDIHSMVVEDDKAFLRLQFCGIHTGGPLLGYPATGCLVAWECAMEFTMKDGLIFKVWEMGDMLTLERQLQDACRQMQLEEEQKQQQQLQQESSSSLESEYRGSGRDYKDEGRRHSNQAGFSELDVNANHDDRQYDNHEVSYLPSAFRTK